MLNKRWLRIVQVILIFSFVLTLTGCATAWVGEASNIIALLVPAIQTAIAILAAFGVGIPASALAAVNTWASQSETALAQVKALIDQYNAALPSAQPGILVEIETALSTISKNLIAILPTLHVTDPATQAKIVAVFEAVAGEIAALIQLIPAIQGKVTTPEEMKSLIASSGFKSAKEFKKSFNEAAGKFGKEYKI